MSMSDSFQEVTSRRQWSLGAGFSLLAALILVPFHGPRNSPEGLPQTPGWYSVPDSVIENVCPAATQPYDFRANCRNVIAAWNGGIADTKMDRLIIWGGGH